MAALTSDKDVATRDGARPLNPIPIATGQRIYRGSLVIQSKTTGRARAGTVTTGHRIAGLAVGFDGPNRNGVGNTAGTEYVLVDAYMPVLVNIRTAIRTNAALGCDVFLSDDQTVGGTGIGTSAIQIKAGELIEFEASDKSTGWVFLRQFSGVAITV